MKNTTMFSFCCISEHINENTHEYEYKEECRVKTFLLKSRTSTPPAAPAPAAAPDDDATEFAAFNDGSPEPPNGGNPPTPYVQASCEKDIKSLYETLHCWTGYINIKRGTTRYDAPCKRQNIPQSLLRIERLERCVSSSSPILRETQ